MATGYEMTHKVSSGMLSLYTLIRYNTNIASWLSEEGSSVRYN